MYFNKIQLRGGSRIFLRRGAPLRDDVTDGEVKKLKSEYVHRKPKLHLRRRGGGVDAHPLHPPLDPPLQLFVKFTNTFKVSF